LFIEINPLSKEMVVQKYNMLRFESLFEIVQKEALLRGKCMFLLNTKERDCQRGIVLVFVE
jgi:hypothetical protein